MAVKRVSRDLLSKQAQTAVGKYRPYYVNSWAAVIGINRYITLSKPLSYAVADAESIANQLIRGLGFPKDNVFVILDPPPTKSEPLYKLYGGVASKVAIEELLLTVLPSQAQADDRVFIFFAGHGERRPLAGNAAKGYLMPADAAPGAWHQWVDIESVADSDLYKSKHVFYILDACYSGLAATRSPSAIARYQQDLLTRRARQVLTAGKDDQVVSDIGGDGHSIFTHFLLKGISGEAGQKDTLAITGFDLMRYVTRNVALATNSKQTPDEGTRLGHAGGDFVFRSPEDAREDLTAQERVMLGRNLYDLGLYLASAGRFKSAIRQFEAAIDQTGVETAVAQDAWAWIGKCRAQLSEYRLAIEAFEHAYSSSAAEVPADVLLWVAVSHARQRDRAAAATALAKFLARFPDHAYAGWAHRFREALQQPISSRRALLIANDHYEMGSCDLREAVSDALSFKRFLIEDCAFRPEDVTVLVDEAATRASVIGELKRLASETKPEDFVFIYRRGHGTLVRTKNMKKKGEEESASVFYDFDSPPGGGFITAREMHKLISSIPAREKTVVTDEDHASLDLFARLEGNYALFQACGATQIVSIRPGEGTFTRTLLGQLRSSAGIWSSVEELKIRIEEILNTPEIRASSPQFVANGRSCFTGAAEEELRFINLWELAECRLSSRLNPAALKRMFEALNSTYQVATTAKMLRQLGRALLEKGAYAQAAEVLEEMIAKYDLEDASTWALLLKAYRLAAQSDKKYEASKKRVMRKMRAAHWNSPERDRLKHLLKIKEFPRQEQELQAFLEEVNTCRLGEGPSILEKLIQRREERFSDEYPEGRVNLGLFYGAAGDFKRAADYLDSEAVPALHRCVATNCSEFVGWQRDAWLFMGRWLYNGAKSKEDLLHAVVSLEKALPPGDYYDFDYDVEVTYWYAKTLRQMISLDLMPNATDAIAHYLLHGSPFGFEDDLRKFIKA